MFEGRAREYKRDLIEKAQPHLGGGEEVRVLALAQVGVRPMVQSLPFGVGGAVIGVSLFGDAVLPAWAVALGALVLLAGMAFAARVPRRLLLRTDERLYAFELPARNKAPVEAPVGTYELADLPPASADAAPTLKGRRLYPNYGASGEREAIAEALEPLGSR